jgi:hypothetical protein
VTDPPRAEAAPAGDDDGDDDDGVDDGNDDDDDDDGGCDVTGAFQGLGGSIAAFMVPHN